MLVAAPVGAGHVEQGKTIGRNIAGARHVRATAEVLEGILAIGRDHRAPTARRALLFLAGGEPVDQLKLVRLILEERSRFLSADDAGDEGVIPGDDAPHAPFDLAEVVRQ